VGPSRARWLSGQRCLWLTYEGECAARYVFVGLSKEALIVASLAAGRAMR
jgi:hypothetical protein